MRLNILLISFCLMSVPHLFFGQGQVLPAFEMSSSFCDARKISIWLPDGYPRPGVKYAVLYMHDGQNLFETATAYGHKEWQVDETLTALIKDDRIVPCIVVGIWNTSKRFREYAPARPFSVMLTEAQKGTENAALYGGQPLSDAYLRFIVEELKPWVDAHFEVDTSAKSTFIAGSSMGGLISLYALCEYPQVFGGAACISTHWPLRLSKNSPAFTHAMIEYLKPRISGLQGHKIYFDYGTETLDAFYETHQVRIDSLFRAEGFPESSFRSQKFEGAAHNEASWAERFHIPALFLLGKKENQE
jgi:pimeloyl-ACP methyl ester carboxylesterase